MWWDNNQKYNVEVVPYRAYRESNKRMHRCSNLLAFKENAS